MEVREQAWIGEYLCTCFANSTTGLTVRTVWLARLSRLVAVSSSRVRFRVEARQDVECIIARATLARALHGRAVGAR